MTMMIWDVAVPILVGTLTSVVVAIFLLKFFIKD
jgi:hypothetical protein